MLKATRLCRVQCLLWTLILISAFLCSQSLNAQGAVSNYSNTVTINETNATLKSIFKIITKQTKLKFLGSSSSLNLSEKHSINVKNATVDQVLYKLLKGKGLSWSVEDGTIIIKKDNEVISSNESSKLRSNNDSLITVTGKIVNERNEPIAGATILVKGTHLGTKTNTDGSFQVNSVKPNSLLIISSVAFLTQEFAVNGRNAVGNISLKGYVGELDETIIIGYGIAKRRTSTSTISVLKADEIEKQPVSDPLMALQGRIPGMIVTPTSGNFGAKVNIQIRGQNSLNFQSNPLFIVDDVPIDNENFKLNNTIADIGTGNLSPFSFLNINDIESISVLKDADATAIYGSRGANGVILITTKRGKAGRTKITLNAQIGYGEVAKKIKLLNTFEYLRMRKEAYKNDGLDYTLGPINSANSDLRLYDSLSYTDWQKVMIGGHSQFQDYQGNISGGSTAVQYTIGGNLHRETTVYPGTNSNQKGSMHFGITGNSPSNKFKVSFTGNYLIDNMNTGRFDYTQNIFLAPNAPPLLDSDGLVNWAILPTNGRSTFGFLGNPYANNLIRNKGKIINLIASFNASYEVLKGLKLKIVGGYNRLSGSNINTTPSTASQPTDRNNIAIVNLLRQASYSNNIIENVSVEPQVTYSLDQGKSNFNFLLGTSLQNNTNQADYLNLNDFTSDALLLNQSAAATVLEKYNTSSQYKYSAIFTRLTYKWDEKYILSLNARRDGSSRFGPGYQFGNFGSIAAAWIFSEEALLKNRLQFLSFGKIKISYGITGNDGIGNYSYFESYGLTQSSITYQNDLGYTSNGAINSDYHWETVKKKELSLELGFMKDKLLFQFNYFRNHSENQLIYYPIPTLAGYGNVYVNLPAKISNTGLELSVSTVNIKSKYFSWNTTINYTSNRNKLINYPSIDKSAYYLTQIGQPFYGYVNVYRFAGVNPTDGQYQFYDNKGIVSPTPVNSGPPYYGQDARIITYPKFYGGISNSIAYRSLSLDFMFQFTKQMGVNPLLMSGSSSNFGVSRSNILVESYNRRWRAPGDDVNIMKLTTRSLGTTQLQNVRRSDGGYTDASFVRLKNVSISYTLPLKWIQKYGLQNCRLFLQGQNVYTFTKYKGLDPETQSFTSLPPLRMTTLGASVTF